MGVDTGGTFTDFIYKDGDKWGVFKTLSTPENPAKAVLYGIEKIAKDKPKNITHGSTVATNAVLERKGMVLSDIVKDYSLTVMLTGKSVNRENTERFFKVLEERAIEDLKKEGIPENKIKVEKYLDMRYKGQSFELIVPFVDDFIEAFHKEHERVYGYSNRKREVEVVNVRIRAIGETEKPELKKFNFVSEKVPEGALLEKRKVYFDGKWMETSVYDREKLLPGNRIEGAAIVVEYSSTTVIPPFAKAFVDEYRNLIIEF
ncbi:MAG: hypothetical protein DSY34_01965 [Desulfurobacterium sp.]|nr:MAG: hypothetical protein DSY34_01965 [Desulfurobacterium sp.]